MATGGVYKVRRQLKAKGGARIGEGDTNYADFAKTTGRLTFAGTGRVRTALWIPATDWVGKTPDQFGNAFNVTNTVSGSTPTVAFNRVEFGSDGATGASSVDIPVMTACAGTNEDARASTMFLAPPDADTSGSVSVQLYYTTRLDMATTGSMQVWRLHYNYMGTSGSHTGGTSGSILYGASMVTTGSGKMEVQTLGTIPSFNFSSSPIVMLQLTLEQSNACGMSGSPEEDIFGMGLTYTANSLGTASSE